MVTVVEVLEGAFDFLRDPTHWTKGMFWRDGEGRGVSLRAGMSCACIYGAVAYVTGMPDTTDMAGAPEFKLYVAALEPVDVCARERTQGMNQRSLCGYEYNDLPEITHQDVLDLLSCAIVRAKEAADGT